MIDEPKQGMEGFWTWLQSEGCYDTRCAADGSGPISQITRAALAGWMAAVRELTERRPDLL